MPPSADEVLATRLMAGVSREAVWGLLEHCREATIPAGHALLVKGQANNSLYLLLQGRLRVHLGRADEPVAFVEPGVPVGELSVLDGTPASATVEAEAPSRLLVVDQDTFWRVVRASHEFATNLLLQLGERMRNATSSVQASRDERRHLEHVSQVDPLTGLRNRRWLDENLPRIVDRERRAGRHTSVVLADVDHFKSVNDTHGHLAGDEVLRVVGRLLLSRLRPSDVGVRYGGEEMIMVLPGTDAAGAVVAAERVRRLLADQSITTPAGARLSVTASFGAAQVHDGEDGVHAIHRADEAMYRAKHGGRNRTERAD